MYSTKRLRLMSAAVLVMPLVAVAVEREEVPFHEWDGSRSLPVHRISLFAEDGQKIDPVYPRGMPFSTRKTCGSCHDYEKISTGWHFNYGGTNAPKGRGGQPWILMDKATGTTLPVAGRGWANTWKPQAVGMTPWDFVMSFGRHLPGGGPGETEDSPDDPVARWTVSGKLEINCLACHSGSQFHDHSEWAKQIARQNFRWAAVASSGLADVGGMASRLPGYWDIYAKPNPDDKDYATPPTVKYNLSQFDSKGRAFVNIAQKPQDKNCLYCHSVAEAGRQKKDFDVDVHTRAGLGCADCHRNGIGHMVTRGFEAEARIRGDRSIAGLSCRGCHLGSRTGHVVDEVGGRLGAPRPLHRGLPPAHLDKISCTTCHSGPWPENGLTRVKTARANRLGIYGVARWETEMPVIVEPVYMKGEDGKIAPYRMTWPAFWAKIDGENIVPLQPSAVTNIAGDLLYAQKRVGAILEVLAANETNAQAVVYVRAGKAYRNTVDRDLEVYPRKIETPRDDSSWCAVNDGVARPFIPEFDPDASSVPDRIEPSLKALAAPEFRAMGAPCVVVSNKMLVLDILRNLQSSAQAVPPEVKAASGVNTEKAGLWWLKGGKLLPLVPDDLGRFATEVCGTGFSLTEDQVAQVLKLLAGAEKTPATKYAYVSSGRLFTLGANGSLVASANKVADPCAWPMAHEVRSSVQALGARGCTDCHSETSPFFFAEVRAVGPLKTSQVQVRAMHEFQGQDASFQRLFGWTFKLRPLFKLGLIAAGCLIGAVLLLYGLLALNRTTRYHGTLGGNK